VALTLLLDEMFPAAMADQLCAKGHDVRAVAAIPFFVGLPDEEILIGAAATALDSLLASLATGLEGRVVFLRRG
jgi:hypothetical protein